MYEEIYQAAFESELEKIAALGGFAGTVAAGAQRMGARFVRKMKQLPRSLGAKTERIRRVRPHIASEQKAMAPKQFIRGGKVVTVPRAKFSMGSPGDLTASYHRGMARKHISRSGIPQLQRGLAVAGGLGAAGVGGSMYLNSRQGR